MLYDIDSERYGLFAALLFPSIDVVDSGQKIREHQYNCYLNILLILVYLASNSEKRHRLASNIRFCVGILRFMKEGDA